MSRRFIEVGGLAGVGLLAALVLCASAARAGDVGFDLNIRVGNQPREVIVREPVAPPPVVVIEEDVQFIFPEGLGFYVAVGVPYDLFYVRNNYYLFREGRWFMAAGSRGPWMVTSHRDLPPGLRRHRIEQVRSYRDSEYEVYRHDRDHYRGRHFHRSKEEWKELRREEKERRKEERREEKEERRHHRGRGHGGD